MRIKEISKHKKINTYSSISQYRRLKVQITVAILPFLLEKSEDWIYSNYHITPLEQIYYRVYDIFQFLTYDLCYVIEYKEELRAYVHQESQCPEFDPNWGNRNGGEKSDI